MTAEGMTLHVDDYDDEGTCYVLIGRGTPLASYCVQTIRRAIEARMTERERIALGAGNPEHAVRRVIAEPPAYAPRDPDYLDDNLIARAREAVEARRVAA